MVLGRLSGDMGWEGGDDEGGREVRTVGGEEERDLVNYADINESAVGVRIPWITSFMCLDIHFSEVKRPLHICRTSVCPSDMTA